ncbi:hypothetical protein TH53_06805 [Pedobacter lusitanus]|uniref:Carrier domain-containing protein n=3 Tax=Pedobacter lusitanus TaxID=1503925 RepID=A0A0D0GKW7_9SPHI|nr:hypothetical protein TH53_06805 [Pedobacter lusitanus]
MVIGENRIEWRWDKKIGEWPGLIPEIMRGNLLLDTLVSNAVEIRLTRDFPLAKINEVQLDDIKNILKDSEDLYPLSPIQEGLLLRTVYWPESDAYLNQNVIELKGSLDIKSLNDAWNRTVNKYEILRSGYLWKKLEVPLQYVNSRPARQMEFCDWRDRAVTAEEKDACLEEFLASDRSQLFDMEEAGLFRLTLAQTGDDSYLLIWTHHHILLDGWCLALIWGDVFRFYADFTAGKPVAGTPPRSYHDYIAWLEQNPPGVKDREFWRNKLKGFGEATLFSALPSYVEGDFRTDRITISEEKLSDLRLAAAQTGITVNAYVQATWALLLGFRTGKKDVVHGISVSGRPTALTDSENIVGLFINTIPLRSDLSPARTLHELLLSTQENFASANNHSFLPLAAILVEWEGRTSNDKRLFDSLIAFENYPDEHLPATKVADIEIRDRFCNEKTEYPIGLIVLPGPPMEFHFNYDSRHFSVETMVQFAEDFFYLLDQLVYTPEKTLASLFLPSMEVLLKKTRSHALPVKISTTGLSEDVFINADKFPDKIAVIAGTEKLSWKELSKAVLRVASSMTTRASSQIIAICAERSVSFVIAALAAWKAGLVPVIFNPALSDEMICDVLQKMGNPDLAVTSKQYFRLNAWKSNGFIIDLVQGDEEKSFHNQIPDPIAAILMTSGTSGLPKQVMLTREGLANRVTATVNLYNRPDPCLLANAAPGFDIGLWEILFSVQQGGTLVLADDEDMKDPDHICELISSNQVNTLHLVPSFGEVLLTGTKSFMLSGIKLLITGGEVVHPAYISRIKEKMADAQVWQGYGPTEASVSVLDQNCNQVDLRGKRLPLGLPTANCQVYLLDEALRLCPEGVCGMIYIGGVAVAAGYFKDPRKTAAAFIPDPFGLPGERLYCTGDQGVRRPDGSIEFIGRKDRQVKIRGFRVELGFVEYQLASHPLVLKAAVMPNPELEDVELIAFIKLSCDPGMNDEEVSTLLQNWLTEHLPVWACPSKLFIIGDFPLTANGKIDMDKLFAEKPETRAVLPMDLTSLSEKEQVIWDVWTQILNTPPASRHENFFTAGGHSLSAMRFCMLLQQKLGEDTKVPVALLFKYGTPATLAEAISINDGSEGAAPCIYTIGEGEGIPLVLIHPVEGTSIAYGQLPALLPGQKIIVIDDPRFHKTDGFSSLREMAALYTEWIRLHTDDGPVILGGWSFGGLIALEIARLMSDHGRVPDGVLLIDSYNFSKRIAFLGEQTTGKSIDSVPDKIDEKLKAELNREIKRNRLLALSAPEMTYKGKVTLLKAEDRPEELDLDLGMNNGWTNAHLPSLQVKYVPGNHHELFSKSYIPALAAALKTFIQEI